MDQIFIKDLRCRGIIGIPGPERNTPQDILVNLVLFCDTTRAAQSDNIEDCVDYSVIAKRIFSYTQTASRFTVEALAADIAAICLENIYVASCRVRVEKPGAVRFTASTGIEIERTRQ
jgi:FolB domain-containing protein